VWTQQLALRRGGRPVVNVRVIRRPPVVLALLAVLLATGTYYVLLFCLAQYFQRGLERTTLASGLILVPWVVAFGVAGQLTRRLPPRYAPSVPAAGYGLLAPAYAGLCAASAGHGADDVVLIALLAVGRSVSGPASRPSSRISPTRCPRPTRPTSAVSGRPPCRSAVRWVSRFSAPFTSPRSADPVMRLR
jgi:hypothetical protein